MSSFNDPVFFFSEFGQARLFAWGSVCLALLFTVLLGLLFYRRYLGISSGKAFLLVLLTLLITALFPSNLPWLISGPVYPGNLWGAPMQLPIILIRLGLVFLLVPFCAKIYLKWVHDHQMTEAERQPGMEGVRAWLGGGNLILAFLISVFASLNGFSFFSTLLLSVLALLAYPLFSTVLQSAPPSPELPREDLSPEREKVMKLLEDGKITPDEASELLNALGQTVRSRELDPVPVTPSRRTVVLGAALLVIGFLLPWTSFPNQARLFSPDWLLPEITGGHMPLGWVVLLLGLGAAAFPYLTRHWDRYTQRNWILAALGLGGIILLVLLLRTAPYFGMGLILVTVGYALQFLGTLREYQQTRA